MALDMKSILQTRQEACDDLFRSMLRVVQIYDQILDMGRREDRDHYSNPLYQRKRFAHSSFLTATKRNRQFFLAVLSGLKRVRSVEYVSPEDIIQSENDKG